MSWDPSDDHDDRQTCRACKGLGYWPGNHDRGAIPCGCNEPGDGAEDDEEEA